MQKYIQTPTNAEVKIFVQDNFTCIEKETVEVSKRIENDSFVCYWIDFQMVAPDYRELTKLVDFLNTSIVRVNPSIYAIKKETFRIVVMGKIQQVVEVEA
jgi:hypothetical protein